ncbi:YgiT-type zinc finger protein [Candidatus Micrarchaeota archaeon]|nr:YgiT-type zinc finger protein [Candidatus Micrarchaeota archaeon]
MTVRTRLVCTKCGVEAEKALLPLYEHEKGIVLRDVEAFRCPNCGEFVFDEKQIIKVERRTQLIKVHRFSFKRKLTVSGRSLVVNIPEDIVRHMGMRKGQAAMLVPVDDKHLLIEVD